MNFSVVVTVCLPEPIDPDTYFKYVGPLGELLTERGMTDVIVGGAATDRCLEVSLQTEAPAISEAATVAQSAIEQGLYMLGCDAIGRFEWKATDQSGNAIEFEPVNREGLKKRARQQYSEDPMAEAVAVAVGPIPPDSGFAVEIVKALAEADPYAHIGRADLYARSKQRLRTQQHDYSFLAFVSDLSAARGLDWIRENGEGIALTDEGRIAAKEDAPHSTELAAS